MEDRLTEWEQNGTDALEELEPTQDDFIVKALTWFSVIVMAGYVYIAAQ